MSCLIVPHSTIDRAVCAMAMAESSTTERMEANAGDELGNAMLTLNHQAYSIRYGVDASTDFQEYKYKLAVFEPLDAYKGLQCVLYQCCEGDIPRTSELYQRMAQAQNVLANTIVRQLPDYELYPWAGDPPEPEPPWNIQQLAESIAKSIKLRNPESTASVSDLVEVIAPLLKMARRMK